MFFNSIKEINKLRREINRLLSKGYSCLCIKEKAATTVPKISVVNKDKTLWKGV